jgi:5-methyltetrahydrofolate corrinoid/iron sulfur protein methyltransferase
MEPRSRVQNGHVPSDGLERLNIALELFTKFQATGLDPEKLIIDPIIAPLLWDNGNQQDMEILSVIRNLPGRLA